MYLRGLRWRAAIACVRERDGEGEGEKGLWPLVILTVGGRSCAGLLRPPSFLTAANAPQVLKYFQKVTSRCPYRLVRKGWKIWTKEIKSKSKTICFSNLVIF